MDRAFGRHDHYSALVFCSLFLLATGCSGFGGAATWGPFAGGGTSDPSGITAPAERMEQLRKLAQRASSSGAEKKAGISQQLAAAIQTEDDPLIRAEIIRALGEYPGAASDSVLRSALNDSDAEARIAACEAWGKRGNAEAISLLSGTLRSDVDVDVRLAAARALGDTDDPAAVAALGEVLTDRDPAMQYRAVISLRQITGKNLGNDVNRWRQYVQSTGPSRAESVATTDHRSQAF